MDKKQFDEVLINALYLLGGDNNTPFKDIIFFDEEKDIDDKTYHNTMNSLECINIRDDSDLFDDEEYDYDYDISPIKSVQEAIDDIKSKLNIDKIQNDIVDKIFNNIKEKPTEMFDDSMPVIGLDPDIYRDLDVYKYDLTLKRFKVISDEDIMKIEELKKDLADLNTEMLNNIKDIKKNKDMYCEAHRTKSKMIDELYTEICDKKTEEIEDIMCEFCEYVISSKYCNSIPSVVSLVASTIVSIRNYVIIYIDTLFKPLINIMDSDLILTMIDLL